MAIATKQMVATNENRRAATSVWAPRRRACASRAKRPPAQNAAPTRCQIRLLVATSCEPPEDECPVSANGIIVAGSVNWQLSEQFSAGLTGRYDLESWKFSTPNAFGSVAPWGDINRPSVGLNLAYQHASDLAFFVAPQIEWDFESGASAGNAKNYGAVVGATTASRLGTADVGYLSSYPHIVEDAFIAWRALLPDDRLVELAHLMFGLAAYTPSVTARSTWPARSKALAGVDRIVAHSRSRSA